VQDEIFGDCSSAIGDINGDGFDDMIVGAYGHQKGKGRVEVYLGGAQGLAKKPSWAMVGEGVGDNMGYSHGSAGDIDGDGFGDLLVGAKYNAQAGRAAGKAWAFLGSAKGIRGAAPWIQRGEGENAMYANRLYSAGDVNGDGYGDVIAGAPGAEKNAGKSYVYLGSAKGLSAKPNWTYVGPAATRSGHSVNSAGDVNGDGYDDVTVAIADVLVRQQMVKKLAGGSLPFESLIHPEVYFDESNRLGRGCLVCGGVQMTVDIRLGDFVIINLSSTIGHDVEIGDLLTIQVLTWEHHTTAKYIFYGKRTGGTLMTEPGTTVHWMGKEEIKAKAKEEWIRNMNEVLLLGLEGYKIDARAAMFYENGERIIRRARVPFFLPIKMPKNRST
jgi:hypothetical protein